MNSRADIAAASAEDEALRWLADFDDMPEVEQARFRAWLGERPENRAAFEDMERDWRRLDVVRQLATAPPDPDVVEKWLRRRRLRRVHLPVALAAGLAAVAITFLLSPQDVYEASFQTAIGEHQRIVLPDESVITLNTNSEVSVRYSDEERRVYLVRGEGHFAVAAAPERPFTVVAGSGTVSAIGTAFNVYLRYDVVEVTVIEGTVEVVPGTQLLDGASAGVPKRLEEGQMLEYRETIESVSSVDADEIARKLAWRDGMLDFRGDLLTEVIEEASRYTATRITLEEDPELKDLRVEGYFRVDDVEALLERIDSDDQVAVRRIGPGVVEIKAARD